MADEVFKRINIKRRINKLEKRFVNLAPIEETPGPGYYNLSNKKTPKKYNAVFVSKTKRGCSLPVKDKDIMSNDYINDNSLDDKEKLKVKNKFFRLHSIDIWNIPGFQSNLARFPSNGANSDDTNSPGPGYYDIRISNKISGYVSKLGNRDSYHINSYTPGPGFYIGKK